MKIRVEELEKLAAEMIGDGQKPNLFFVSKFDNDTHGCIAVTPDFDIAYEIWKKLPTNCETALEDRMYGTICDNAPHSEEEAMQGVLHLADNSEHFLANY